MKLSLGEGEGKMTIKVMGVCAGRKDSNSEILLKESTLLWRARRKAQK